MAEVVEVPQVEAGSFQIRRVVGKGVRVAVVAVLLVKGGEILVPEPREWEGWLLGFLLEYLEEVSRQVVRVSGKAGIYLKAGVVDTAAVGAAG